MFYTNVLLMFHDERREELTKKWTSFGINYFDELYPTVWSFQFFIFIKNCVLKNFVKFIGNTCAFY